jgi:hypothetical protein
MKILRKSIKKWVYYALCFQKPAEARFVDNFFAAFRRLFMALLTILWGGYLDDFVDNFYGFICFALYAAQSSSTQHKSLLHFLEVGEGGGCRSLS